MSISTRITLAEYERMTAAGAFEGGLVRPRVEMAATLPMSCCRLTIKSTRWHFLK